MILTQFPIKTFNVQLLNCLLWYLRGGRNDEVLMKHAGGTCNHERQEIIARDTQENHIIECANTHIVIMDI